VPPALLSGHHDNIARWRREQRLFLTARHRPDILQRARENGALTPADERYLATLK
jgi:tRNA (guanine37-N1)-methyltransferase